MPSSTTRTVYEYRELDSLDEVNRLGAEGYDLFQAVAVGNRLRYLVRRVGESDDVRRAGFTAPAPE
ncbi:MAG: hypothetical protein M0T72_09695 [Candidatus Dormibacteraeota bacterium]|nr:hypothetical protein [Candidatus Dormibacteraeota bacterium]